MPRFVFAKSHDVPAGTYRATLNRFFNVEGKFSPQVQAEFIITEGEQKGAKASYWANREQGGAEVVPRPTNKLGKLLQDLAGRELRENEEVDPQDFFGQLYEIVIKEKDNGGYYIESIKLIAN